MRTVGKLFNQIPPGGVASWVCETKYSSSPFVRLLLLLVSNGPMSTQQPFRFSRMRRPSFFSSSSPPFCTQRRRLIADLSRNSTDAPKCSRRMVLLASPPHRRRRRRLQAVLFHCSNSRANTYTFLRLLERFLQSRSFSLDGLCCAVLALRSSSSFEATLNVSFSFYYSFHLVQFVSVSLFQFPVVRGGVFVKCFEPQNWEKNKLPI